MESIEHNHLFELIPLNAKHSIGIMSTKENKMNTNTHRYTKVLRILSTVVVCVFAWTSIVSADPAFVYRIKVPSEYGKVKERFKTNQEDTKPKTIIHIQDAHASLEAQKNIAELIDYFNRTYDIDLIAVEGAVGSLDMKPFRDFPFDDARDAVAYDYLQKGIFSGAEYQSVINLDEVDLFGAEDPHLFRQNFSTFYHALQKSEEILIEIDFLDKYAIEIANAVFSDDVRELVNLYMRYQSQDLDMIGYLTEIHARYYRYIKELLLEVPALQQFYEVLLLEETIDFKRLEKELSSAFEKIKEHLNDTEKGALEKKWMQQANIKEQAKHVSALAFKHGVSVKEYTTVCTFIEYTDRYELIDFAALFEALDHITKLLVSQLSENKDEVDLFAQIQKIGILQKICSLQAANTHIKYFTRHRELCSISLIYEYLRNLAEKYHISFQSPPQFQGEKYIQTVEEFYACVEKRNYALIENTLQRMKERGREKAILIGGGYHSEGLTHELRNRGIEYVVITPHISSVVADIPYIEKMTGKLFPISSTLTSTIVGLARFLIGEENETQFINAFLKTSSAESILREVTRSTFTDTDVLKQLEKLQSLNEHVQWEVIVASVEKLLRSKIKDTNQISRKQIERIIEGIEFKKDVLDIIGEHISPQAKEQKNQAVESLPEYVYASWKKQQEKHLEFYIFSRKLWEVTAQKRVLHEISPQIIHETLGSIDFSQMSQEDLMYWLGFLTANNSKDKHAYSQDTRRILWTRFKFNVVLIVAMQRAGISIDEFIKMKHARNICIDGPIYKTIIKEQWDGIDDSSFFASTKRQFINSDRANEAAYDALFEQLEYLCKEILPRERPLFYEYMLGNAENILREDMPSVVLAKREVKELLPPECIKSPAEFIESQESILYVSQFDLAHRRGLVGEVFPLSRGPILSGTKHNHIRTFSLADGRKVYTKRLDFMKMKHPDEEWLRVQYLDRLFSQMPYPVAQSGIVGLIYDKGMVYEISFREDSLRADSLFKKESQPFYDKNISTLQELLREETMPVSLPYPIKKYSENEKKQWAKVFEYYDQKAILSEKGKRLKALLEGKEIADSSVDIGKVLSYFDSISNMNGKEIKDFFPEEYFIEISIPQEWKRKLSLELLDGCMQQCYFCLMSPKAQAEVMPYPILIALARKEIPVEFTDFLYEPLYYKDPSGALFYDVLKLFKENDLSMVTHGYMTYANNSDPLRAAQKIAEENLAYLNSRENKLLIHYSVVPTDLDLRMLISEGRTDKEIEQHFTERAIAFLEALGSGGHTVDIRLQSPPEETVVSLMREHSIIHKVHDNIERYTNDKRFIVGRRNQNQYILTRKGARYSDDLEMTWNNLRENPFAEESYVRYVLRQDGSISTLAMPPYVPFTKKLYEQISDNAELLDTIVNHFLQPSAEHAAHLWAEYLLLQPNEAKNMKTKEDILMLLWKNRFPIPLKILPKSIQESLQKEEPHVFYTKLGEVILRAKTQRLEQEQRILQANTLKSRTIQEHDLWMREALFDFQLQEYIAECIRDSKTVNIADLGCGLGIWLNQIKEKYGRQVNLTGVDVVNWHDTMSEENAAKLQEIEEKYSDHDITFPWRDRHYAFLQDDIQAVTLPENMDVMTSFFTLQYVDDPIRTICNAYNQLKPGGVFVGNIVLPASRIDLGLMYQKLFDHMRWNFEIEIEYSPPFFETKEGQEDLLIIYFRMHQPEDKKKQFKIVYNQQPRHTTFIVDEATCKVVEYSDITVKEKKAKYAVRLDLKPRDSLGGGRLPILMRVLKPLLGEGKLRELVQVIIEQTLYFALYSLLVNSGIGSLAALAATAASFMVLHTFDLPLGKQSYAIRIYWGDILSVAFMNSIALLPQIIGQLIGMDVSVAYQMFIFITASIFHYLVNRDAEESSFIFKNQISKRAFLIRSLGWGISAASFITGFSMLVKKMQEYEGKMTSYVRVARQLEKDEELLLVALEQTNKTVGSFVREQIPMQVQNRVESWISWRAFLHALDTSDWIQATLLWKKMQKQEEYQLLSSFFEDNRYLKAIVDKLDLLHVHYNEGMRKVRAKETSIWYKWGRYPLFDVKRDWLDAYGFKKEHDEGYFYYILHRHNNIHMPSSYAKVKDRRGPPVDIVQGHHHALHRWYRALPNIKDKRPQLLIHFDAHPDLSTPRGNHTTLLSSLNKGKETNDMSAFVDAAFQADIAGYITPAVYDGLIDEMLWIIPEEARKREYGETVSKNYMPQDGSYTLGVVRSRLDGHLYTVVPESIFAKDDTRISWDEYKKDQGLRAEERRYGEMKEFTLHIRSVSETAADGYSDLGVQEEIKRLIDESNKNIIVNWDMDVTGTKDPSGTRVFVTTLEKIFNGWRHVIKPNYRLEWKRRNSLYDVARLIRDTYADRFSAITIARSPNFTIKYTPQSMAAFLLDTFGVQKDDEKQPKWVQDEIFLDKNNYDPRAIESSTDRFSSIINVIKKSALVGLTCIMLHHVTSSIALAASPREMTLVDAVSNWGPFLIAALIAIGFIINKIRTINKINKSNVKYELSKKGEEAVRVLIERIKIYQKEKKDGLIYIAIDGAPFSGKTTFAKYLKDYGIGSIRPEEIGLAHRDVQFMDGPEPQYQNFTLLRKVDPKSVPYKIIILEGQGLHSTALTLYHDDQFVFPDIFMRVYSSQEERKSRAKLREHHPAFRAHLLSIDDKGEDQRLKKDAQKILDIKDRQRIEDTILVDNPLQMIKKPDFLSHTLPLQPHMNIVLDQLGQKIQTALSSSSEEKYGIVAAIDGASGVGKTELAFYIKTHGIGEFKPHEIRLLSRDEIAESYQISFEEANHMMLESAQKVIRDPHSQVKLVLIEGNGIFYTDDLYQRSRVDDTLLTSFIDIRVLMTMSDEKEREKLIALKPSLSLQEVHQRMRVKEPIHSDAEYFEIKDAYKVNTSATMRFTKEIGQSMGLGEKATQYLIAPFEEIGAIIGFIGIFLKSEESLKKKIVRFVSLTFASRLPMIVLVSFISSQYIFMISPVCLIGTALAITSIIVLNAPYFGRAHKQYKEAHTIAAILFNAIVVIIGIFTHGSFYELCFITGAWAIGSHFIWNLFSKIITPLTQDMIDYVRYYRGRFIFFSHFAEERDLPFVTGSLDADDRNAINQKMVTLENLLKKRKNELSAEDIRFLKKRIQAIRLKLKTRYKPKYFWALDRELKILLRFIDSGESQSMSVIEYIKKTDGFERKQQDIEKQKQKVQKQKEPFKDATKQEAKTQQHNKTHRPAISTKQRSRILIGIEKARERIRILSSTKKDVAAIKEVEQNISELEELLSNGSHTEFRVFKDRIQKIEGALDFLEKTTNYDIREVESMPEDDLFSQWAEEWRNKADSKANELGGDLKNDQARLNFYRTYKIYDEQINSLLEGSSTTARNRRAQLRRILNEFRPELCEERLKLVAQVYGMQTAFNLFVKHVITNDEIEFALDKAFQDATMIKDSLAKLTLSYIDEQNKERVMFENDLQSLRGAIALSNPSKIALPKREKVLAELLGQIELLRLIIETNERIITVDNVAAAHDVITVTIDENSSLYGIKKGSPVHVFVDNKGYPYIVSNFVSHEGKTLLVLEINKNGVGGEKIRDPHAITHIGFESDLFVEKQQLLELERLYKNIEEKGTTGVEVIDYILGLSYPPKMIEDVSELMAKEEFTNGLDIYQRAAVNLIVKSKFGLLHGPFGTGKTKTVLATIKNLVLDKKKTVLMLAPQNALADDITIQAGAENVPVLRFGKYERFSKIVQEKYARQLPEAQKQFFRKYFDYKSSGYLLVATPMGGSLDSVLAVFRDPEMEAYLKDLTIIIDEAALINYPELITALSILAPERLILMGDHIQFAPFPFKAQYKRTFESIRQQLKEKAERVIQRYETSVFKQLIYKLYDKVKLMKNYRNHWIVVELAQSFYPGLRLESFSRERGDLIDEHTFEVVDTYAQTSQSYEYYDPRTGNYINETEAQWILEKVHMYLQMQSNNGEQYAAKDITIITPYNGQLELIRSYIENDSRLTNMQREILSNNVTTSRKVQGAENKIVLVSFVRSDERITEEFLKVPEKLSNSMLANDKAIIADPSLLLVTFTRASERFAAIGNSVTLSYLTKGTRDQDMYERFFKFGADVKNILTNATNNKKSFSDEEFDELKREYRQNGKIISLPKKIDKRLSSIALLPGISSYLENIPYADFVGYGAIIGIVVAIVTISLMYKYRNDHRENKKRLIWSRKFSDLNHKNIYRVYDAVYDVIADFQTNEKVAKVKREYATGFVITTLSLFMENALYYIAQKSEEQAANDNDFRGELSIRLIETEDGYLLEVEDNGTGIPRARLEKMGKESMPSQEKKRISKEYSFVTGGNGNAIKNVVNRMSSETFNLSYVNVETNYNGESLRAIIRTNQDTEIQQGSMNSEGTLLQFFLPNNERIDAAKNQVDLTTDDLRDDEAISKKLKTNVHECENTIIAMLEERNMDKEREYMFYYNNRRIPCFIKGEESLFFGTGQTSKIIMPEYIRVGPLMLLDAKYKYNLPDEIRAAYDANLVFIQNMSETLGEARLFKHTLNAIASLVAVSNSLNDQEILDLGSGIGTLAIVAKKLGARHVIGMEINERSILYARSNKEVNGLSDNDIQFIEQDIQEEQQVVEMLNREKIKVGVVIANIGPWMIYHYSNRNVMNLLGMLETVHTFIGGGYVEINGHANNRTMNELSDNDEVAAEEEGFEIVAHTTLGRNYGHPKGFVAVRTKENPSIEKRKANNEEQSIAERIITLNEKIMQMPLDELPEIEFPYQLFIKESDYALLPQTLKKVIDEYWYVLRLHVLKDKDVESTLTSLPFDESSYSLYLTSSIPSEKITQTIQCIVFDPIDPAQFIVFASILKNVISVLKGDTPNDFIVRDMKKDNLYYVARQKIVDFIRVEDAALLEHVSEAIEAEKRGTILRTAA